MGKVDNRAIRVYLDTTDYKRGADELAQETKKYAKELENLEKAGKGTSKAAEDLRDKISKLEKLEKKYNAQVKETERILSNLSGATYTELIAAKRKLSDQLKIEQRGTEKHKIALVQYKRVCEELTVVQKEMRVEVGSQGTAWGKAVGAFNKYAAVVTAGIAAITGVTMKLNQLRELRDQREDVKADVKALTGLDMESINWLEQQAMQLSTAMNESGIRIRQSATEILDAYKLVGSAKPELLENKEALAEVTEQTLILASASGMKLKDAVDAVTLSMNQYGAEADQASRFTNVMAAGSKYGSAAVESVTSAITKSGVAAASAGIPIEQLVGTIETLAEKGIKDEIAGTGLKKFFLTLQTGADETNPKVVGLETALDNLQRKQLSATEIKKTFGEEGYNVASVLINEAEQVRYYTQAVTGTVVALEQANDKSQTAAAIRAQTKNKLNELGIQLMNRLSPSITSVTNGIVRWSNHAVTLIGFIVEHGRVISTLVTAIIVYTAAIKAKTVIDRIHNSVVNAGTVSVKSFTAALKLNPWGIAIAGIASLISYYTIFKEKTDQATTSNSQFNASLEETKAAIDRMNGIRIRDANRDSLNKRQLQELRSQSEQEIRIKEDLIVKETVAMRKAKEAKEAILGDETKMKESKNRKEAQLLQKEENASRAIIASARKEIKELQTIVGSIPIEKVPSDTGDSGDDKAETAKDKARKVAIGKEKILYSQQQADLKTIYAAGNDDRYKTEQQYNDRLLDLKKAYLNKTISIAGAGSSEAADAKNQLGDILIQERKKAVNKAIEEEKSLYEKQQRDLKEVFIAQNDEKLDTQEEYEKAREKITLDHLERSLEIAGLDADARKSIEEQLFDFRMKCVEEELKERKKAADAEAKIADNLAKKQTAAGTKQHTAMMQYANSFGEAMGNIITGQENALASFGDSMVDIVFDVLETMVDAELVRLTGIGIATVAEATAREIGKKGLLGLATGAALAATIGTTIAAARAGLKSLIGGKKSSRSGSVSEAGGNSPSANVTVRQWAKGRYDVIGQDDGKTYNNVPYIGPAPTGIVRRTSLISENGSELIINAEDLSRLQRHINYPVVIEAIQDARSGRVPQRANGNYDTIGNNLPGAPSVSPAAEAKVSTPTNIDKLIEQLSELMKILKNLRAYVVLRDLHDAEDLDRKSKQPFTKSSQ